MPNSSELVVRLLETMRSAAIASARRTVTGVTTIAIVVTARVVLLLRVRFFHCTDNGSGRDGWYRCGRAHGGGGRARAVPDIGVARSRLRNDPEQPDLDDPIGL
ncbi:MAG TPA: hypothetical protein VM869_26060, partial [Enhygromyxa sp.]|nr:hypothetical protein [Enhygromyxa sp.]